jgi:hypothetical protein
LDNIPDDAEIDVKVRVDQAISQAHDLIPGRIWMLSSKFRRGRAASFSDDLQLADDAILDQAVL